MDDNRPKHKIQNYKTLSNTGKMNFGKLLGLNIKWAKGELN